MTDQLKQLEQFNTHQEYNRKRTEFIVGKQII